MSYLFESSLVRTKTSKRLNRYFNPHLLRQFNLFLLLLCVIIQLIIIIKCFKIYIKQLKMAEVDNDPYNSKKDDDRKDIIEQSIKESAEKNNQQQKHQIDKNINLASKEAVQKQEKEREEVQQESEKEEIDREVEGQQREKIYNMKEEIEHEVEGQQREKIQNMKEDIKEEEKRRRRTRNDDQGRNFTCVCGKAYLSYPALYTHLKNKQCGRAVARPVEKVVQAPQQQVSAVTALTKFLQPFFHPNINRTVQLTEEQQSILRTGREYWEIHKKEDEPHQNQTYSTPLDLVLARFLLAFETQPNRNIFKYLAAFIVDLRASFRLLRGAENVAFVAELPCFFNDIFLDLQKTQDSIYARYPTLLCKALLHLAQWLFDQKFTNYNVKLNTI